MCPAPAPPVMALDCDPESLRFRRKFDGYLKPARPGTEISAFGRMMATKTLAARARHIERDLGRALKEREQVRKRSRAARVRDRLMVVGQEEMKKRVTQRVATKPRGGLITMKVCALGAPPWCRCSLSCLLPPTRAF